jgi:hypothetical protein
MRPPSRNSRRLLVITMTLAVSGLTVLGARAVLSSDRLTPAAAGAAGESPVVPASSSTSTSTSATTVPVSRAAPAPARTFATGNAQLDALLPTFPAVLFDGGGTVHFGWNPLDTCCHAGGYNPVPNEIWVGQSAFASPARLTYVAAHELAHSVHIKTVRNGALTAAVAGAPVVRAGPWDDSEKVADCVAWVLFPAETAASGITYWTCPDPWRSQVLAALR